MRHICIRPTTFAVYDFQHQQNPYITDVVEGTASLKKEALKEHASMMRKVSNLSSYTYRQATDPLASTPDIVFVANGGMSLPMLPEPVFILPRMKYEQRQRELPFLQEICKAEGLHAITFPSLTEPFEGQAEAKWFHSGKLLICGYGHRSTKKTFKILQKLLDEIYGYYRKPAPKLLVLPLESADYYHLDVAMLEFNDDSCIVHKRAFSPASIKKLQQALGKDKVHVLETNDSFCLNAVVDGKKLLTHVVSDDVKNYLEETTGRKVHMTDTHIFEKSGGSVRCMILDIHATV
jgi:N-dimethylarginine dimethylaminohydrolase